MKRVRALSEQERALWAHVARSVKPVRRGRIRVEVTMEELLQQESLFVLKEIPLDSALLDTSLLIAAPEDKALAKARVIPKQPPLAPIEKSLRRKLNRGKTGVDGKIDLHGMRQDEAHGALIQFIGRAAQRGDGLVLIVTGKGGRKMASEDSFPGTGVLRRMVPIWLSDPSMRRLVIGFEEAAIGHGGAGALYVRLRRTKA